MAKAEYRSAIRSRKLINDALADLLAEKPLDKITVTDVATRADINRGTFYAHYRDIPDVVDNLIQEAFSTIRDTLMMHADDTADIGHQVLSNVQIFLEKDLQFYRKLLNSNVAGGMLEKLIGAVLDFMMENREMIGLGQQEQYQVAIRFCAGGLSNLYRDWFAGKIPCTLSELTVIGENMILKIFDL